MAHSRSFGKRFGISAHDLDKVMTWLESHGMEVEEVPASRRAIVFSATAAQVESTLRSGIRNYSIKGAVHYANAKDPEAPSALAQVGSGVVSMHDFFAAPPCT
jgi:subtilase family serine protease